MAKVKSASLTKESTPDKTIQTTLHLSSVARKLLWQSRVDTGNTISSTMEALIMKHLSPRRENKI